MVAGRTIWLDQLSPEERSALEPGLPEALDLTPDVLVVGGGIVGVATAGACRAAGLGSVLLLEASHLGSGATGGAAGLLIPDAHQGNDPDALVQLGRASLAQWRRLEAGSDGVGLIELDWFGLDPRPDEFGSDPFGVVDWLDAAEVARLLPDLATATPAARIRHQARTNPLRALVHLAARIPQIATGVAVNGVEVRHGSILRVSTAAGAITPGAVVFATGMPPTLDGLDLTVPADLVKGHLVVTEPVPMVLPGTVSAVATQLEDGRLLAGGPLELEDSTDQVNTEVVDRILADLIGALPALHSVRVTNRWCCWRPHHPDGLPVIDRVPGLDNAWITSGHFRTGILMAPATGAMLAEWIATGQPPPLADPWKVARLFSP